MDWRIVEAPHVESLDHPDAWAYRGIAEVERQVALADRGTDDAVPSAHEIAVSMADQTYRRRRRLVAVDDVGTPSGAPRVVGHGFLGCDLLDNQHMADVYVAVAPPFRGQGIGGALADAVVGLARSEPGRTTVLTDVEFGAEPPAGAPDAVVAPTGNGRISANLPGLRLARRAGIELKMIARRSVLRLPVSDGVTRLAEEARAAAGPDYRLHVWRDEIPERWLAGYAALEERLTVDEPNPGLDVEPEHWDADRLRHQMARLRAAGRGWLITAAEHEPTGELVAASMLLYSPDREAYSEQETTVVVPEHRGRRLGMLVKCANLREHTAIRPATARIWTWNNEDNPHMLAINVALGFRPAGGAAMLQAELADVRSVARVT